MAKSTRETFVARIAAAARSQPVTEPNLPELAEGVVRMAEAGEGLLSLFTCQVGLSGAVPHVADTPAELAAVVKAIVAEEKLRSAVADADESARPLVEAFEAAGVAVKRWAAGQGVDGVFEADAGLTGVTHAVAETGTLVVASSPLAARLTSLAPRVHVALVRQGQIVPDLMDLLAAGKPANPASLPSSMTLITGPSKTADIELKLVTGVHGPARVHVINIP